MVYNSNKQYNTRNSVGRYNTPGQFVTAATPGSQQYRLQPQQSPQTPQQSPQQRPPQPPQPRPVQPPPNPPLPQSQSFQPPLPPTPMPATKKEPKFAQRTAKSTGEEQEELQDSQSDADMKMESDLETAGSEDGSRPPWMKSRLAGFKKINKKERRRRQNQHLRRLITPKNALMVLNEMLLTDQLSNQFKVEPSTEGNSQYYTNPRTSFCADLTLNGINYKGYGENKLSARNAAAEQAIRDLIIQRMQRAAAAEPATEEGSDGGTAEPEETLPMIQLASFALHKLFSEWEYDGHKVPQLRPPAVGAEAMEAEGAEGVGGGPRVKPPKPPRVLPANAASMHPSMLLAYMRPHLEYRELGVDGDRPQNMLFTMGVDVDGATYIGKASNKKEARKLAAKAACTAILGVRFEDPAAVAPATT